MGELLTTGHRGTRHVCASPSLMPCPKQHAPSPPWRSGWSSWLDVSPSTLCASCVTWCLDAVPTATTTQQQRLPRRCAWYAIARAPSPRCLQPPPDTCVACVTPARHPGRCCSARRECRGERPARVCRHRPCAGVVRPWTHRRGCTYKRIRHRPTNVIDPQPHPWCTGCFVQCTAHGQACSRYGPSPHRRAGCSRPD